jgi:nickel transport protein
MRRLALALSLAVAVPALAHEVLHEVRRGNAVAVRAWFPDGESLAYVQAEVFSPRDAAIPHWKGRTDRNGWLAFVPDVPGAWRVRIVDASGHGLDTTVDVPSLPGADVAAGAAAAPPSSTLAFVLRPVVGVAVIAAVFGGLFLLRRTKST